MSDKITSCIMYKNLDGSIRYYEVIFSLDNVPVSSSTYVINKDDLNDSSNLDEVEAVACQRAKETKILYSNVEEISYLNGSVSL